MSDIQLKSANLPTKVSRKKIEQAVDTVFERFGIFQVKVMPTRGTSAKKAAKKK
jgi:hypothetical protein